MIKSKYNKKKNGFTLVELIAVIAILGIVTSAATMVFMFSNRSFQKSTIHHDVQSQSRTLFNELKNEIGFADSVILHTDVPSPLPSDHDIGYIYALNNSSIIYKKAGQEDIQIVMNQPQVSPNIQFEKMNIIDQTLVNTVKISFSSDIYDLSTDIHVQNLSSSTGISIIPPDTTNTVFSYLEYTLPIWNK